MSDDKQDHDRGISFQCPHCSASYRAPRQAVGKSLKCPKCGGAIQVAGVMAAAAEAAQATSAEISDSATVEPAPPLARRFGTGAIWAALLFLAVAALGAELLVAMRANLYDKADWFIRPALGCVIICAVMLAVGAVGRVIVRTINSGWLAFASYLIWPPMTVLLLLLFVVPGSYWFPYLPNWLTERLASSAVGLFVAILAKYASLVPMIMMLGLAWFANDSPVHNVALAIVKGFANLLWFPAQLALFLFHAPRVWWVRQRYGPKAIALEKRIEKRALEFGKQAEPVLPQHVEDLPDLVRDALSESAEIAAEIHAWRHEHGQEEDRGIKQALDAAAGVIGTRLTVTQRQELESLDTRYQQALRNLALMLLKTSPDILRQVELDQPVAEIRQSKEIAMLGEVAEEALADSEASLPLAVRAAYRSVAETNQQLQACDRDLGPDGRTGFSQAFSAATSALRGKSLSGQQQAELDAIVSKQVLAMRELGLALASLSQEELREIGLEEKARKLRDHRDVLEIGRAAEAVLPDHGEALPPTIAARYQQLQEAADKLQSRRHEFGLERSGSGLTKILGGVGSVIGKLKLTPEQKQQLASLAAKREQAIKDLGIVLLGADESLLDAMGLRARLEKLRDSKENLALGQAGAAVLTEPKTRLADHVQQRLATLQSHEQAVTDKRHELGLDEATGVSAALGTLTAQLRGGITAKQKQELETLNQNYQRARQALGLALVCADGDWRAPADLEAEIDRLRRSKPVSQLGARAERLCPKFENLFGAEISEPDLAG